ncbi:phytanoyl-CoA dioxygenase family protein [Halioxenophilus sp. WMMB6]|uniref:phytanoyl-CoA dioxygenase family protein n=1 Tax=Halioxenophilus sp. WMMB6 TaxID=3073815 RepID=UPI00295EC733|nr:phytanoyl-CoA dioxygenase family protein [Halioxenophilus sp. WMMB6]
MSGQEYPNNLQQMDISNHLLKNANLLKQRMKMDGYLYFSQILPVEELFALRAKITSVLADCDWISGGKDKMEARSICMPAREGEEEYFRVHDQLVKVEELYRLAQNPKLLEVMKLVLGDGAFPHPLSIIRLVFPNNPEITTPPHQDFRNNQGTDQLTAAWIPLSDCPISMGPIAVLKGSHNMGVLPLEFHLGPGNRRATITNEVAKLTWVSTDFKLGDVLLFPALTVHSALENRDPERMRLSVDFRYQLEGEALVEQSLNPHFQRVSWSDIYKTWKNSDLQYYWQTLKFRMVEWDQTLQDLPDDHLPEAVRLSRKYNVERLSRFQKKADTN